MATHKHTPVYERVCEWLNVTSVERRYINANPYLPLVCVFLLSFFKICPSLLLSVCVVCNQLYVIKALVF